MEMHLHLLKLITCVIYVLAVCIHVVEVGRNTFAFLKVVILVIHVLAVCRSTFASSQVGYLGYLCS